MILEVNPSFTGNPMNRLVTRIALGLLFILANAKTYAFETYKPITVSSVMKRIAWQTLPISKRTVQLIAFFERETGLQLEVKRLPWNRAKLVVANGDGLIYGLSKTTERLNTYLYSAPVITENVWVVTYGEPVATINTAADLRGRTVFISPGMSFGSEFEQAKNTIFKTQLNSDTFPEQLKYLISHPNYTILWAVRDITDTKQAQAYFQQYVIQSYDDADLLGKTFNISNKAIFVDTVHFASAKGKFVSEIAKIDEAIARGIKSGELSKILKLKN